MTKPNSLVITPRLPNSGSMPFNLSQDQDFLVALRAHQRRPPTNRPMITSAVTSGLEPVAGFSSNQYQVVMVCFEPFSLLLLPSQAAKRHRDEPAFGELNVLIRCGGRKRANHQHLPGSVGVARLGRETNPAASRFSISLKPLLLSRLMVSAASLVPLFQCQIFTGCAASPMPK